MRAAAIGAARSLIGPALARWVDAEDVASDVVANLLVNPPPPGATDILAAARARARTRVIDLARKHRNDAGPSAAPGPAPIPDPPLTGPVTSGDDCRRLRELVAGLPSPYAAVMRMVHLDGLDTAEAAERLGVAPATARKRLQRGRDLIRGAWKGWR